MPVSSSRVPFMNSKRVIYEGSLGLVDCQRACPTVSCPFGKVEVEGDTKGVLTVLDC